MAKKALIIDPDADRRALYKQKQPQYAPGLELTAVATLDEALSALATAPFDTIVLSAGRSEDGDQDAKRLRQLQRACLTATCYLYNTKLLSTDERNLVGFFRLFSFSVGNLSNLYPRLDNVKPPKRRKEKTC